MKYSAHTSIVRIDLVSPIHELLCMHTISVSGNFSLRALGTPMIFKSLYEATKKVGNPNSTEVKLSRKTVYDTWMETFPWKKYNKPM